MEIPFTVPPRFVLNVVTPDKLSSPQKALLSSASHLGTVLEACPTEKQTRKEILDYRSVEPWRRAACSFDQMWFSSLLVLLSTFICGIAAWHRDGDERTA